jgi:hypothetical protein
MSFSLVLWAMVKLGRYIERLVPLICLLLFYDFARGKYCQTPLYEACYRGHTDIVEVLLQSGRVF